MIEPAGNKGPGWYLMNEPADDKGPGWYRMIEPACDKGPGWYCMIEPAGLFTMTYIKHFWGKTNIFLFYLQIFSKSNNRLKILDKDNYLKGASGKQIPEETPGAYHCGTSATGWLNGSHPQFTDATFKELVCFDYGPTSICDRNVNVEITNCGDFFVYLLPEVPSCYLRYCSA